MSLSFSVVISTYSGEQADYLEASLHSIFQQTHRPDEVILVADGPVPADQLDVIDAFISRYGETMRFSMLDTKLGRGGARNHGVSLASHEWVAIMDSDDLAYPNRFEEQVAYVCNNEVDIVVGWQTEFLGDETNIINVKKCPPDHAAIVKSLKFRCRIPNPTIFFKKSIFERVGGYGDYALINEDHDLFVKLACSGAVFGVINKPLINVRITDSQRQRRGLGVLSDDLFFRISLYKRGYYSFPEFLLYFSSVAVFRATPVPLKDLFYKIMR